MRDSESERGTRRRSAERGGERERPDDDEAQQRSRKHEAPQPHKTHRESSFATTARCESPRGLSVRRRRKTKRLNAFLRSFLFLFRFPSRQCMTGMKLKSSMLEEHLSVVRSLTHSLTHSLAIEASGRMRRLDGELAQSKSTALRQGFEDGELGASSAEKVV